MKKFLTLITLAGAFSPALHGIETSLPADIQKQYDNLTVHIQNADVDGFKPAFDALTLPAESITALKQTVLEIKIAVTKELETMGDNNKNWSKIVKGGLATLGGFCAGVSGTASLICRGLVSLGKDPLNITNNNLAKLFTIISVSPSALPLLLFGSKYGNMNYGARNNVITITALAYLGIAYKGLTYGPKTLEIGLNYKEHLQNMLANLDAIDAHITQANA